MQIELLQKYVGYPIVCNQMQLSLAHAPMISGGLNVNTNTEESVCRDGSILEYCRLKDITIQTWSPFQFGHMEGVFINHEAYPELNRKLRELAETYCATPTTIALAWILRHPAKMQAIVGTSNRERMTGCVNAAKVHLQREDWYGLYMAAGHNLP